MTIILRIDSILNELFPNYLKYGKDINVLVQDITEYYTSGPYKPTVNIKDNLIHVEIDIPTIKTQQDDYDKAVKLCDQGKYEYAIPILNKLIKKNPSVSEYHRILGQVYFDQGKHEEAINYFIDALKWDPNNPSALIMMGNVLSIYKDDIKSALKYYDQALTNKPNDNILLNNIGANLLKLNRLDEGLRYLEIAYESDPDYANTLYNLTLFYDIKEDYQSAFDWGIKTMRGSSLSDQVHKPAYQMVIKACKALADKINQKSILEKYLLRLEDISEYPIEIVADNSISYPARIEYAEVHSRDKHIIRHKENYPYITHIVSRFFESFDKEAIANKLVSSHPSYIDMAAEDLIAQWDQTAVDGTEVHNEIDAYIKENRPPTLPKSILAVEYLNRRTKENIELTSEVIIYSKEMKLAGTIDLLVYNKDKDLYKIIDWKTSKKIEMSSFGNKTGTHAATEQLMDCNYIHYSLQLSLYRYILEREYGLKVHNCELCHLSDSVKDIRCEYHKDTIEAMLIAEGRIE